MSAFTLGVDLVFMSWKGRDLAYYRNARIGKKQLVQTYVVLPCHFVLDQSDTLDRSDTKNRLGSLQLYPQVPHFHARTTYSLEFCSSFFDFLKKETKAVMDSRDVLD